MTDVNVLRMEDGRIEAWLIWESTGIASCIQVRKENLEITRTQQYIDSNLVPVQIGVQPKSMDKSKHGKDARNESSEKVKDDDQRWCYYCSETVLLAKSQSRTRLKDLADAKWKPVTVNIRLSSTAADAPLTDDYMMMFLVTVPHVTRKPTCARVKIETTMRSDAGSTAPTRSERVREGEKNDISGGREKKSAKFWATHPSGPHGPTFSGFGPPPFGPHHDTKYGLAKIGWPKLVKSGLQNGID